MSTWKERMQRPPPMETEPRNDYERKQRGIVEKDFREDILNEQGRHDRDDQIRMFVETPANLDALLAADQARTEFKSTRLPDAKKTLRSMNMQIPEMMDGSKYLKPEDKHADAPLSMALAKDLHEKAERPEMYQASNLSHLLPVDPVRKIRNEGVMEKKYIPEQMKFGHTDMAVAGDDRAFREDDAIVKPEMIQANDLGNILQQEDNKKKVNKMMGYIDQGAMKLPKKKIPLPKHVFEPELDDKVLRELHKMHNRDHEMMISAIPDISGPPTKEAANYRPNERKTSQRFESSDEEKAASPPALPLPGRRPSLAKQSNTQPDLEEKEQVPRRLSAQRQQTSPSTRSPEPAKSPRTPLLRQGGQRNLGLYATPPQFREDYLKAKRRTSLPDSETDEIQSMTTDAKPKNSRIQSAKKAAADVGKAVKSGTYNAAKAVKSGTYNAAKTTAQALKSGTYNAAKTAAAGTIGAAKTAKSAAYKAAKEVAPLSKRLYGDEDTDSPIIRTTACIFNCGFMTLMIAFLLTSFFLMGAYPVLVPDVFNTVAVSGVFLWMRLWWLRGSLITAVAVGAAVWSFVVNLYTFWLYEPVTYVAVSTTGSSLALTSTLNRTVMNGTHVVGVTESWWDGVRSLHMVVMINECFSMFVLLLMTICQFNVRRRTNEQRRQRGLAVEVTEREVRCMQVVGKCFRCEYCRCDWFCCAARSQVVTSDWSDTLVLLLRIAAGISWGMVLASLGLTMASAFQHIPAWTTQESPHFFLMIGLLCWIFPPIGETFSYAPDQIKRTAVWAPRFVIGGVFLVLGLAISTWTIVLERQHTEWTSGAQWLSRTTYVAKLDGSNTIELYGGYTYQTVTVADLTQLVDYAMAHHVIELILVILSYLVFALGTVLFFVDSSQILPDPTKTGDGEEEEDIEQGGAGGGSDEECQCGGSSDDDDDVRVSVTVRS